MEKVDSCSETEPGWWLVYALNMFIAELNKAVEDEDTVTMSELQIPQAARYLVDRMRARMKGTEGTSMPNMSSVDLRVVHKRSWHFDIPRLSKNKEKLKEAF